MVLDWLAGLYARPTNYIMVWEACMAEQLKCGMCGGTFSSKKEMDEHVKKAHPKK